MLAHGWPAGAIAETIVQTMGDRILDRPLAEIGGKALWTRELDAALADGRIDVAVHSMKDVETRLAPGIQLAAYLPRADVTDRIVGVPSIAALVPGARVGTSSPRRAAQLRHRRPDVEIVTLRGNVGTRLARIAAGDVAATFLASAGLDRLGLSEGVALPVADWLPAVAQGAVGITCRADDPATVALLSAIDDAPTRRQVEAERALLEALGGSCHTAIAAYACPDGEALRLEAELYSPDGAECVRARAQATGDPCALARSVAADLLAQASAAIRRSLAPPA